MQILLQEKKHGQQIENQKIVNPMYEINKSDLTSWTDTVIKHLSTKHDLSEEKIAHILSDYESYSNSFLGLKKDN